MVAEMNLPPALHDLELAVFFYALSKHSCFVDRTTEAPGVTLRPRLGRTVRPKWREKGYVSTQRRKYGFPECTSLSIYDAGVQTGEENSGTRQGQQSGSRLFSVYTFLLSDHLETVRRTTDAFLPPFLPT